MGIINKVEERFGDEVVSGTVVVQSVIEISKQDYDAFNERIAKMNKIIEGQQRMEEVNEELGAYNSYKRHMRVFGKSKEILPFEEWKEKFKKKQYGQTNKGNG